MKSSRTIRTLILFSLIALVGVGLNVFAFFYLKDMNTKVYKRVAEVETSKKRDAELFGPGGNSASVEVAKLYTHTVDADEAVALFEKIENDANDQGLNFELESVSIDPPEPGSKNALTEKIRLHIEASASWEIISHFIFYLEHMPYRTILENVQLSRLETAGKNISPEWRLRAEVVVLKLK